MIYEYDKTYTFEVAASFGDLSTEQINKLYRDARKASGFLELQLEIWFPELEFVDAKGYDHVNRETGRKLDAKCFTEGGLCFAPSVMRGAGRKIDESAVHEHAATIDYIACDIVEFPIVRIRFIQGSKLIKEYPNKGCKVPFSKRNIFFELDLVTRTLSPFL